MPYCPKCGYDYQPGYAVCPDCGVELEERPAGRPEDIKAPLDKRVALELTAICIITPWALIGLLSVLGLAAGSAFGGRDAIFLLTAVPLVFIGLFIYGARRVGKITPASRLIGIVLSAGIYAIFTLVLWITGDNWKSFTIPFLSLVSGCACAFAAWLGSAVLRKQAH